MGSSYFSSTHSFCGRGRPGSPLSPSKSISPRASVLFMVWMLQASPAGRTHWPVLPTHPDHGAPEHARAAVDATGRHWRDHVHSAGQHRGQRARLCLRPPVLRLARAGAPAVQLGWETALSPHHQGWRPSPAQPAGDGRQGGAGAGDEQDQPQTRPCQSQGPRLDGATRLLARSGGRGGQERALVLGGVTAWGGVQDACLSHACHDWK